MLLFVFGRDFTWWRGEGELKLNPIQHDWLQLTRVGEIGYVLDHRKMTSCCLFWLFFGFARFAIFCVRGGGEENQTFGYPKQTPSFSSHSKRTQIKHSRNFFFTFAVVTVRCCCKSACVLKYILATWLVFVFVIVNRLDFLRIFFVLHVEELPA